MRSLFTRRHTQGSPPAGEVPRSPTPRTPARENTSPSHQQRRADGSLQILSEIQSAPSSLRPTVVGPPTTEASGGSPPRRSLRDLMADNPHVSHEREPLTGPSDASRKSGKSGLAKFTSKVKKLAGKTKTAVDRNFVSSQVSLLGVHTKTTVGKPVTMSATKPQPEVLKAGTVPADMPPAPAKGPDHTSGRQRKINAAVKATLNPPTSFTESLPGPLGRRQARGAPSVSITEAMSSRAGMEVHVARLFGQKIHDPAVQTLQNALHGILSEMAAESPRPFAQHVLLAESLVNACGRDATRAIQALRALQAGTFLPARHPESPAPSEPASPRSSSASTDSFHSARSTPSPAPAAQPSPQARLDAMHAAQQLAGLGDVGMQALLAAVPQQDPAKHEPLEFVLLAAEQITTETKGAKARLPDILEHATSVKGKSADTLACKVLRAAVRALDDPGTYADLDRADKAAVFSWRQGFRSDGKNSPLRLTQQRLAKFRKYVSRAEKRDTLNKTHFNPNDPVRSAGQMVDKTARLVANNVQRVFSHKKSPLLGMGRHGSLAAGAQHVPTDQVKLDEHLTGAMKALKTHLEEAVGKLRINVGNPEPVPSALVRAAVLEHWIQASATQRPQGYRLDRNAVSRIAARIHQATGNPLLRTPGRLPPELEQLAGAKLTHATLEAWGHEAAMPLRREDGKETDFGNAMRRAGNILDPGRDKPVDMTADNMRAYLKNFVAEHNGGNSMTFTDGGALGINTGAISVNMALAASAATHIVLNPIIDVQASVARSAVFNIGTTPHGGELFVGRQRQIAGQVGGGVSLGYGPQITDSGETGLSARLGVAVNTTLFGLEHNNPIGVRLRFATQRKTDGSGVMDPAAMRDQMGKMLDYMFDACQGEKAKMKPDQLWEDFANAHFDQKSLSVSWQDYSTLNSKVGGSVTANGRLGVQTEDGETIRGSGSVGYAFSWNPFTKGQRREQSGNLPILRNDEGSAHMHSLTLTHNVQLPTAPLPGSHEGVHDSLGVPALPVHSVTYMLGNGGFNATIRTLMDHGRHSDTFTYKDLSERSIGDFLKFANEPGRREEWEAMCAAEQGGDRALGKKRLDDFLGKIKEMARPNQAHYLRWRMGEEERLAMDDFLSAAQLAERGGRKTDAKGHRQAMEAIAVNEASWRPHGLFTMHANSKQTDTGLNFGLQATARTTAASDRELMFIGLPLPISDAWTKVARTEPTAAES